jgi:hypothetical protein
MTERARVRIVVACLVMGMLASCSGDSPREADATEQVPGTSVEGVLTVGSVETALNHVYFDHRADLLVLLFSDKPLSADDGVYSGYVLAQAGEVSGLTVSIDKADPRVTGDFDWVFHPGCGGVPDSHGEGVQLEVVRLDDELVEARVHQDQPQATGDSTFTFDVSFSVPGHDVYEVIEAEVDGADTPPAEAYESFIHAVFALDAAEAKRWCSAEMAAKLDRYDDIKGTLDDVRSMHPLEITILSSEIAGEAATLQVEGERKGVLGKATVAMVLEDGGWKVQKEKWEFKQE